MADVHGTREELIAMIAAQREDIVRLTFALNKAKEDCRVIMQDCDTALLHHINKWATSK